MCRKRTLIFIFLFAVCIFPGTGSGNPAGHFPRLANYYLPSAIGEREVEILSRWDLLILYHKLDLDPEMRDRLSQISQANPDIIMLIYHSSVAVNTTEMPPDPMEIACDQYGWWLRDYEDNRLNNPAFTFGFLMNMTNTAAASGTHPQGKSANSYLAEIMVEDHLELYDYWSGIFYDVFSDNLAWMYRDIKDANRNGIPEYDFVNNGNEPAFNDLWWEGSLTLLENTLDLFPHAVLVGNGQHRGALDLLNGRLWENYERRGSRNMHELCANHKYLSSGEKLPPISIVNGWMREQDLTRYQDMRFTLCSTLMTDNYYSCDFGSQNHGELLWYDEYSVRENGDTDARVTTLYQSISSDQEDIRVGSTDGFSSSGIIQIEGEQIYYESKSDLYFQNCRRGFPSRTKYDLRSSHPQGATVIQHYGNNTGYLGSATGPAYDVNEPSVLLDDLFAEAGWSAGQEIAEEIDSRVWRRDFENGTVIVNPTDTDTHVGGLGNAVYKTIKGYQDPSHNNGGNILYSLHMAAGDGYILMFANDPDTTPPAAPTGFRVRP